MNLKPLAVLILGWAPDAVVAAGAGITAYGAWLVYAPAGYLIAGALLMTAGVMAARVK